MKRCKRILPLLILIFLCVFTAASVPASATPYGDFAHAEGDALVPRTNGTVTEQAQSGPYTYIAPTGYVIIPNILLDIGESATYTLTLSNGTVIQGHVSVQQLYLDLSAPFGLRGSMTLGDDTDSESFYNLFGKIEFITAYTSQQTRGGHIITFIANNNQIRGIPNENTPVVSYNIDNMRDTYIQQISVTPGGQYTLDYKICVMPIGQYINNVYTTQNSDSFDFTFSNILKSLNYLKDSAAMGISFIVELFVMFKLVVIDNFDWMILAFEAAVLALSFTKSRDIWQAIGKFVDYNSTVFDWLMRFVTFAIHSITAVINAIKPT